MAPGAFDDPTGIHENLAARAPDIALEFVAGLRARMAWIAESGFTGVPRDSISPGLRALPYRRRCIYFRLYGEAVTVLGVLHGSQDVSKRNFGQSTQ